MRTPTRSAPFTHAGTSLGRIMGQVMVALVPATAFGLLQFGWPAVFLFATTVAAAAAFDALGLYLAGRPVADGLADGTAVLAGWILALTLPPWAPWWIGVTGAGIAVLVGKHVYGGTGQNIFNPAMVARVALLVSFPVPMTTYIAPVPLWEAAAPGFVEALAITFGGAQPVDALTVASPLDALSTALHGGAAVPQARDAVPALKALLTGTVPGSLGETSAGLVLAGGLFMLAVRTISWPIPVAFLGTLFGLAEVFHQIDPMHYPTGLFHLSAGSVMLAAFFVATDPVTSPVSRTGHLIFGAGAAAITFLIRTWAGYPEGLGFGILLMNAATPLIDRWARPRIMGRDRNGRPLAGGGGP